MTWAERLSTERGRRGRRPFSRAASSMPEPIAPGPRPGPIGNGLRNLMERLVQLE